jgi:hypothetical protein
VAWPASPLRTYVANSTPTIKAADLNAFQSGINGIIYGTGDNRAIPSEVLRPPSADCLAGSEGNTTIYSDKTEVNVIGDFTVEGNKVRRQWVFDGPTLEYLRYKDLT